MDSCLDRICHLAGLLGIDETAGSLSMAELKGYAAGLNLVQEDIDASRLSLSPDFAQKTALDMFCNMLGVSSELDDSEKRRLIKKRLAAKYGDYSLDELIEKLGEHGAECKIENGDVLISVANADDKLIFLLSSIIDNYISPTSIVYINDSDYNFDKWDSMSYSFNDYDRINLPFNILDQF